MRILKSAALLSIAIITANASAAISMQEATRLAMVVHNSMAPLLEANHKKVVYRWIEGNPYFEMKTVSNNEPNSYMIYATRGLYNHPAMNRGIYLLLNCHELGHVLGGAPYTTQKFSGLLTPVQLENLSKLSAEGQADYFATNVCMKQVLADVSVLVDVLEPEQNEVVKTGCQQMHANELDQRICMASAMISAHTTRLFASLDAVMEHAPTFEPINSNVGAVASSTLDSYPSLQCRLQTFFSGALHASIKTIYEPRPSCWYAPEGDGPHIPREVASETNANLTDPFVMPVFLRRGEGHEGRQP